MEQGYIQIYTGNGKGKTTASLGLTLRAVGNGFKVYFAQFMKTADYSEHKSLALLGDAVETDSFGTGKWVKGRPSDEDVANARAGFAKVKERVMSGKFDLVVLDEANVAVYYELIDEAELLKLMDEKPAHTELVITGRNASEKLKNRADLVTEMGEIKHYYRAGVPARKGIEM